MTFCIRQGAKLAGQKEQVGVGAGAEGIMEDRTSSQSLVVEPGNTVMPCTTLFCSGHLCMPLHNVLH